MYFGSLGADATSTELAQILADDPALKAAYGAPDAVIFVSTTGSDANDGRSPGKAKATIAAALAAGKASYPNGFTVQLGYGTFSADTFPIVIDTTMPGVTIRGCGIGQTYDPTNNVYTPVHPTTVKVNTDVDAFQITGPATLSPTGGPVQYGVRLEDFAIVGAAGTAATGIKVTNTPRITLRRLAIDQHGLWGLSITSSYWIDIDTVIATRNGYAAATVASGGMQLAYPVNLLPIRNCIFNYNSGVGAYLASASAIGFYACDFSATISTSWSGSGSGVATGGVGPYSYLSCWFEANHGYGMRPKTAGASHTFIGCYFEGDGTTPYALGGVGTTDLFTIHGGRFGGHSSHWSFDAGSNPPPSIVWASVACQDTGGFLQGPGNNSSVNVLANGASASGHYGAPQLSAARYQTLSAAGAVSINASSGDLQVITLAANATSSTIASSSPGQVLTITWVQNATGGFTYAWPTNCKFAGGAAPADTTASKQTSVTFRYDGTNWQEISRAVAVG